MDACPDCDGPLKVAPDFVIGMDYVGSIYSSTVVCLACMRLWGRPDGGGLVSIFPTREVSSTW